MGIPRQAARATQKTNSKAAAREAARCVVLKMDFRLSFWCPFTAPPPPHPPPKKKGRGGNSKQTELSAKCVGPAPLLLRLDHPALQRLTATPSGRQNCILHHQTRVKSARSCSSVSLGSVSLAGETDAKKRRGKTKRKTPGLRCLTIAWHEINEAGQKTNKLTLL